MSALSLPQVSRPRQFPVQQLLSRREPARRVRQAASGRIRLTRRGRLVLIGIPAMLLAVLLLSLSGLFNSPAKASDSAADLGLTPTVTVTVQPGQSLWAIAGEVAPGRDARDVVADIVQLNNLAAGAVLPGQQLFVPTR
ncbi:MULTISPECIES: LysM peptidoglycan-binding domain-containing protein [unclassified Arthrobacter]|uniref:LysM peptidoglycan-binding domain-containing protein n=1 Tax=unclassified Arthrobacter TaxID=235627 RepID=UPI001C865938|nr:LysM peptidoglycan-binding domain-containing protein [Arthrobacter sp. MAHUQ-56]MBX7442558.1 LysM peptidoglycan-binding domain-containing protein [Arthrobacter sp. MAHUQ-56]